MGQPRPLYHLFSSFQKDITIFTTIYRYVKKFAFSIRCRDSNSQPLETESPPIITRPGLPATCKDFLRKFYATLIFKKSEISTNRDA